VQQGRAVWHVKVFAIGKAVPQITDEDREGKHTLQLYLDGKIEQFYFTQDKLGVVFLMLVESVDKANATVDALPLAAGGFLNYEFLPVGPLAPFSQLHGWAMRSPTDAFAVALTSADARLWADADRYSFTVVDFHLLLFAGFDRRTEFIVSARVGVLHAPIVRGRHL
jgi:hypothetical protein